MELWGAKVGVKGYFIQYKFIIPDNTKHSSYSYQKLFRALYGYTQVVDKSNGKRYKYYRKGVLSEVPHIRPRKNCVVIPPEHFQGLIEFFKTGRNPAHYWKGKGDWKAVYYMNEKDVKEEEIVSAMEKVIDKNFIFQGFKEPISIFASFRKFSQTSLTERDKSYAGLVVQRVKNLVNSDWFKSVYSRSDKLSELYSSYKKIKETPGFNV